MRYSYLLKLWFYSTSCGQFITLVLYLGCYLQFSHIAYLPSQAAAIMGPRNDSIQNEDDDEEKINKIYTIPEK